MMRATYPPHDRGGSHRGATLRRGWSASPRAYREPRRIYCTGRCSDPRHVGKPWAALLVDFGHGTPQRRPRVRCARLHLRRHHDGHDAPHPDVRHLPRASSASRSRCRRSSSRRTRSACSRRCSRSAGGPTRWAGDRSCSPASRSAIVSDVVFLLAGNTETLLVGRVLSGLSAGIFVGTATAAVVEAAPAAWRSRAALLATAANIGGLGLGPLVAGMLVDWLPWHLHLAFLVHIVLSLVAVALVWGVAETVDVVPGSRPDLPATRRPGEGTHDVHRGRHRGLRRVRGDGPVRRRLPPVRGPGAHEPEPGPRGARRLHGVRRVGRRPGRPARESRPHTRSTPGAPCSSPGWRSSHGGCRSSRSR